MASQAHFSRMPSINIPRTKMKMPYKVSTSFNHGYLVPLDAIPVVPGDTFKLKLSSLIRMSNPIRPIMGDIQVDVHAFFVPMRLVWDHTEEFFGENKDSAGPQTTLYEIPKAAWTSGNSDANKTMRDLSVAAYFGKPSLPKTTNNGDVSINVSVLKERAYCLIWSEWYRAQQVENPFIINKGGNGTTDSTTIAYRNSTAYYLHTLPLMKVNKKWDYFSSATISPQYGSAVELALGEDAPVEWRDLTSAEIIANGYPGFRQVETGNWYGMAFSAEDSQGKYGGSNSLATNSQKQAESGVAVAADSSQGADKAYSWIEHTDDDSFSEALAYDPNGSLVAKLSQATMVNVNELRYAFALQKWLERSNFGSRYFELLQAHYGVTSPDSRLQRPEHIGSTSFKINVSQVLSTAGSTATSETKVGEPGANSLTLDISNLFTKGFVEFGFVVILLDTKHDRQYGQGVLREDSYSDRFDFYTPEFANLGDQSILNKEIFAGLNSEGKNDKIFGYQEHWAEMRYRPSRVTGLLNPAASSSLNFWTLCDKYSTLPQLSEDFLFEDRDAIARCLVSGENGPDYIADFYFDLTAIRPMPAYTIPGLIDHFGAL